MWTKNNDKKKKICLHNLDLFVRVFKGTVKDFKYDMIFKCF